LGHLLVLQHVQVIFKLVNVGFIDFLLSDVSVTIRHQSWQSLKLLTASTIDMLLGRSQAVMILTLSVAVFYF
jgi:hypothetical protein